MSPPAANPPESGTASTLDFYLDTLRRITDDDPLTRAEAFNEAEEAAEFVPILSNRLRYALALSIPGHNGSDPAAAAERLRGLIVAGNALLPEERILATIQLASVEQLLVLQTANAALLEERETALAEQDAANARRVDELIEANRRLATQLEDATKRLDAITSIEQSISERDNGEN